MTESALADPAMRGVRDALDREPTWSDIPIVVLMRDRDSEGAGRALAALNNVSMLDRPVSVRTMTSAVQTALRTRKRCVQRSRTQLARGSRHPRPWSRS